MKQRSEKNGSNNSHWKTPQYVKEYIKDKFFNNKEFFDPCPLNSTFDGLIIDWEDLNYINPPYERTIKEKFIVKSLEQSKLNKLCVMLLPASTETRIFHEVIYPNAYIELIEKRIKFLGYNQMGEYVTNKTGQCGHMFVVFGKEYKPKITVANLDKYVKSFVDNCFYKKESLYD